MTALVLAAVVLQVIVSPGLLFWLWRRTVSTRLQGSVRLAAGDQVTTGHAVGVVDNSGSTTEPHLHVSAQRRAPGDALVGGEPVWVTIEGRYLVRNDRLDCDRQ